MGRAFSSVYERLALRAGNEAELPGATAQTVATDEGARSIRDALWAEYELRLRDSSFTIDQVSEWLNTVEISAARSTIHRDRHRIQARLRSMSLAAEKAAAVVNTIKDSGLTDTLAGGRMLASQLLFEALSNLSVTALDDLKPGEILRLIDTLGQLSTSDSRIEVERQKLIEAKTKFDQALAAAADKSQRRGLTPADIAEARELVFGRAT